MEKQIENLICFTLTHLAIYKRKSCQFIAFTEEELLYCGKPNGITNKNKIVFMWKKICFNLCIQKKKLLKSTSFQEQKKCVFNELWTLHTHSIVNKNHTQKLFVSSVIFVFRFTVSFDAMAILLFLIPFFLSFIRCFFLSNLE